MKYKVTILKQAVKELSKLQKNQQDAIKQDYAIIENNGIEYVKRRFLREGLFEIKTNDVRSLFKYKEDCVILIALIYEKRSNKAPEYYIKLANKRLKEDL